MARSPVERSGAPGSVRAPGYARAIMRESRLRVRATVAALSVAAIAVGVPAAMSASSPKATATFELKPPSFAGTAKSSSTGSGAVACAPSGGCVIVAPYFGERASGLMVASDTRGVWTIVAPIAERHFATARTRKHGLDGVASFDPEGLSCPSADGCVAAGFYTVNALGIANRPAVLVEHNGIWGRALGLGLPSDAETNVSTGVQMASLTSVACTSADNCIAVGSYNDTRGAQRPMVVTESDGTWSRPTALLLPQDARDAPTGPDGVSSAESIACPAVSRCIAVGSYTYDRALNSRGFIDTDNAGVWSTVPETLAPASMRHPISGLQAIACATASRCYAFGFYAVFRHFGRHTHHSSRTVVLTAESGVWSPRPKPVAGYGFSSLTAACAGPSACAVAGVIRYPLHDRRLPTGVVGLRPGVVEQTASGWGPLVQPALPSDAQRAQPGPFSFFNSLACADSGACIAVGRYAPARPVDAPVGRAMFATFRP